MVQEKKTWLEKLRHGFGLDKDTSGLKEMGLLRSAGDEFRAIGLADDKTSISHVEAQKKSPVAKAEQELAKRRLEEFMAKNIEKPQVQAKDPNALKEFKTSWVPQIFKDIADSFAFGKSSEQKERATSAEVARQGFHAAHESRFEPDEPVVEKASWLQRLRHGIGLDKDTSGLKEQGLLRGGVDKAKDFIPFARDNTSMVDVPDNRVSALTERTATAAFAKAAERPKAHAPALAVNVWNPSSYLAADKKAAPVTLRSNQMQPPVSRPN